MNIHNLGLVTRPCKSLKNYIEFMKINTLTS